MPITREQAVDLLRYLVSAPSPSGDEGPACRFLSDSMEDLGYERARIDPVGNVVGEIGPVAAPRLLVLLSHVDTAPGELTVAIERARGRDDELLYGRGSVAAKGSLAAFTVVGALLGAAWARNSSVRIVVIGVVEQESLTALGARYVRDRYDGKKEPVPDVCIIGEPTFGHSIACGFRGRLRVELQANQTSRRLTGADRGLPATALDFLQVLDMHAKRFAGPGRRPFDLLQPTIHSIQTRSTGLEDRLTAAYELGLPVTYNHRKFVEELIIWGERRAGVRAVPLEEGTLFRFEGPDQKLSLRFRGYQPAWQSSPDTALARAFLSAISEAQAPGDSPGVLWEPTTSSINVVGPTWQCPVLAYGPGDPDLAQSPDEHVSLAEYWLSIQILETAIRQLADVWRSDERAMAPAKRASFSSAPR